MKRFAPILLIALGTLLCGASVAQQRGCELPSVADWIGGGTVPIKASGFRVLIVEETQDRVKLPASQREILLSLADGSVRAYLESHCVKDAAGNPEFRILDKDNDLSRDSSTWQEAWKIPRPSLPYLIASNGRTGYAGPLPLTPAETLKILRKVGGA